MSRRKKSGWQKMADGSMIRVKDNVIVDREPAPPKVKKVRTRRAEMPESDPRHHGNTFAAVKARADAMTKYWSGRGYEIEAKPILVPRSNGRYELKTNLVCGAPPGYVAPVPQPEMIRVGSGTLRKFRYADIQ